MQKDDMKLYHERCTHASIPEAMALKIIKAGLLTYSFLGGLPILRRDSGRDALETQEITASGNVQDLHLIPFSSRRSYGKPQLRAKVI
jgi:hypothetical protein